MGGGGGGGEQSPLSKGGLHTNNASNLFTLQLWLADIQLIGLAALKKLNFFINFKQCCLFVLMYANAPTPAAGGLFWERVPPLGLAKDDRDLGGSQVRFICKHLVIKSG